MLDFSDNIVIIGCQRAGKTTLTNKLVENENYTIISVDSLIRAFEDVVPEANIKRNQRISEKSLPLARFISSYLEGFVRDYPNKKFIVESCQLLPKTISMVKILKKCQIVCLGYPNTTVDDFFNGVRDFDSKGGNAYTKRMDDENLKNNISYWIEYSKWLQNHAEKCGIPFFETNTNREEVIEKIANGLLNKEYVVSWKKSGSDKEGDLEDVPTLEENR